MSALVHVERILHKLDPTGRQVKMDRRFCAYTPSAVVGIRVAGAFPGLPQSANDRRCGSSDSDCRILQVSIVPNVSDFEELRVALSHHEILESEPGVKEIHD